MKKFLCSVLVAVLALSLGTCAWGADYWTEHAGTESDPYVIDSTADLIALRERVYAGTEGEGLYYELTTNLSLKNENWKVVADSGFKHAIGGGKGGRPFTGHFDGKGHTIECNEGPALFGTIKTASGYAIKNLTVSGTFTDDTIDNNQLAAGIALSLYDASIENCAFTGTVRSDGTNSPSYYNAYAGGIVAQIFSGTIKNCTLKSAKIEALAFPQIEAVGYSGGIVSKMSGGTIEGCTVDENCVITGQSMTYNPDWSIEAIANAEASHGGIVALLNKTTGFTDRGSVKNNTCKGQIDVSTDGKARLGGIVGEIQDSSISIEGNTFEGNISYSNKKKAINNANATIGGVIGKIGVSNPTISNNRYSGATYGIGADAGGTGSDTGCTKITAEAEKETDTGTNTETNTETEKQSETDTGTQTNTDTKTDTDTEKQSDTGTKTETETEQKTDVKEETGTETKTETEQKTDTNNNGGTGTQTQNQSVGTITDKTTQDKITQALKTTVNFIPQTGFSAVTAPSDGVTKAVGGEGFKISENLTAITVNTTGQQALQVTLPAGLNGKNISDVKIYFVNSTFAGTGSVNSSALPSGMVEGVLRDTDGNALTTVSTTNSIVTADIETAGQYNVYLAEKETTAGNVGSSSGGGCDTGFGIFALVFAAFLKKRAK